MSLLKDAKEQFAPELLIKDLERDAEGTREYHFTEIEKHIRELEESLRIHHPVEHNLKERIQSSIDGLKKILSMEPAYLSLKRKYKDDVRIRLSLAKDWKEYFGYLDRIDDLAISAEQSTSTEVREIERQMEKQNECLAKLRDIENRFERLLK